MNPGILELAMQSQSSAGLESELDLMNLRVECLLACGQRDAARNLAARTQQAVMKLASQLQDPELRRSFLERVEPCAHALTLHQQLSNESDRDASSARVP